LFTARKDNSFPPLLKKGREYKTHGPFALSFLRRIVTPAKAGAGIHYLTIGFTASPIFAASSKAGHPNQPTEPSPAREQPQ
jgi:hypothetical protein